MKKSRHLKPSSSSLYLTTTPPLPPATNFEIGNKIFLKRAIPENASPAQAIKQVWHHFLMSLHISKQRPQG
jgi:hypothetical protein